MVIQEATNYRLWRQLITTYYLAIEEAFTKHFAELTYCDSKQWV